MPKTLLIVDDEERLRALLRDYMEHEGFRVLLAADGREALRIARQEKPDLIILDLMMPEMDGWEFMRRYTPESRTPIIILTARLDDADKVLGLELGADDYVTKPFSPRVLAARVRAVLRRSGAQPPPAEVLRVADIVLDRSAHRVTVRGEAVSLTPSEFDLLAALMSAPGRVFTRLELLEQVQGTLYEGYERTIDVHIRNLRAKIEPNPKNPRYIETVYGVGYRFAAE
ncbi:MAG: response regulator transcription factor [Chloroflexi bacterium]|nr:response regulator transcription factor [Chloroflexota bacterium]